MTCSLDEVERVGNIMKTLGISKVKWGSLEMERDPGQEYAPNPLEKVRSATDEEILMDPFAGLEELGRNV